LDRISRLTPNRFEITLCSVTSAIIGLAGSGDDGVGL
jgi:hypothetical protein